MKSRKKRSVKDYFFPHKGNLYKPYIFAAESVMAMLLVLFIFQSLYVMQVGVLSKSTGFTAAVLPAALTDLTNADRSRNGLLQLQDDPLLDQAAQQKAQDMAANGYFAHVSPTGKTPWYWLDQVGYQYSYAGENLAVDFTDSTDVETAWMNSPLHRANIVKPEYTKIGMAVAQGMYQGKEVTFVVELFAAPPLASAAGNQSNASSEIASNAPAASAAVAAGSDEAQSGDASKASVSSQKPVGRILGTQSAVAVPIAAQPQSPSVAVSQNASVATRPLVEQTTHANPLMQAIASPAHTFEYILISFVIVIVFLLGMALAVHVRMGIQYVEVVGSSAVLVGIAVVLLFFNGKSIHPVGLPSDGQSASVVVAL